MLDHKILQMTWVCVCVCLGVRVCVCARAYRAGCACVCVRARVPGCACVCARARVPGVHANTNTNAADIHIEAYHMHNPRSHLAYYRAITGGRLSRSLSLALYHRRRLSRSGGPKEPTVILPL